MKRLIWALLSLTLLHTDAYAARGFGTTYGAGTTDAVQTGYTTAIGSTITISAWFYRNGAGGGSFGRIFDQNSATATQAVYIDDNTAALANTMSFNYGGSTAGHNGKWHWTTPSSSAWHHLVVTFNGTGVNNPTVYIDGSTVTATLDTTFTNPGGQTTGNIMIGNRADGIRGWDGKLAEVGYWGAILTANEVKSLSKGISPFKIRPASLLLYIPTNGYQASEPDWGPSRVTQTVTGTLGQPHAPVQGFPFNQSGQ